MHVTPRRNAIINLMVGTFAGAVSAAIGAAVSLFFLTLLYDPGKAISDPIDSVKFSMIFCVFGGFFAGIVGLPMGLLIALVDIPMHGRLRASGHSILLWLAVGAVLGAIGSAFLSI